jgi:hypothetical protein
VLSAFAKEEFFASAFFHFDLAAANLAAASEQLPALVAYEAAFFLTVGIEVRDEWHQPHGLVSFVLVFGL